MLERYEFSDGCFDDTFAFSAHFSEEKGLVSLLIDNGFDIVGYARL